MDDITEKHELLVARIRGYTLPKEAEARVLAEVKVICRRERAARAMAINLHPPPESTNAGLRYSQHD